jgi:DedD protein
VDEGLKKRLVGATVLASLVVIFVPMLIDDPAEPRDEFQAIPPTPPKKDFASSMLSQEVTRPDPLPIKRPDVEPEPVPVDLMKNPSAAPGSTPESEPAPVAPPSEPGLPEPKSSLVAWVVKVGSFSNRENAAALVEKLRKAGFQTPDAERIELRGKVLYRVKVGPMVRKEKAEQLLPKINQVSGTEGQVARYQ